MKKSQNFKNLSLREFKGLFDSLSPSRFMICTEDQSWDKTLHPISALFSFSIMLITFNPNTICFKNSSDYLCLNKVKRISVDKIKNALGTVFTVTCGIYGNDEKEITYKMIAY